MLRSWLKDGKYLSHDINNELIEMMPHVMVRNLLSEIKEMEWYSMIADETHNTSGKEQLTISLRLVDKRYDVHEDLIGLSGGNSNRCFDCISSNQRCTSSL